jgi:hypothetical protein
MKEKRVEGKVIYHLLGCRHIVGRFSYLRGSLPPSPGRARPASDLIVENGGGLLERLVRMSMSRMYCM